MSDTPTPPWGIRVEPDVRTEYADAVERLQTRLLHIGLFLLTVVMLGGGAGVLMVVTEDSRAVVVSIAVVAGCVVAVLVALLAAMSATRQLTALTRRPQPVVPPRPVPMAALEPVHPVSVPAPVEQAPQESPLWSRTGDHQVTLTDDPGQRREVFVKLARRLQSLINRAIKRIDELEQDNEDPELLDGLYEIDHLFTLARRQGENLAVLGGEAPQRRSTKPVSVYAVLLAAVSEAEHYRQIAIVPVEDVEIHGHAVAEIIHLLAELLENATRFTSPDGPKVEVRAHRVTAGLAIEVQDRGLGMSYEDLERINHLLEGSTRIDLSELLEDGRIGLAVVRELARRHHISVRLQSNIFGGIAAAVVIPPQLLTEPKRASRHRASQQQQQQRSSALPKRKTEPENAALAEAAATRSVAAPAPAQALEPATSQAQTAERNTGRPVTEQGARQAPPAEQRAQQPAAAGAARPSTSATPPPVAAEQSGPIQVPAPMPIPAASTPGTSAGLGPIRPGQTIRQRTEGGAEEGLPVLPVRAPGQSYDDLRTGGEGGITDMPAEKGDQAAPPPLPQRRGSHLREELLEPPTATRPVPGHNTSLMKTVQAGRDNWFSDRAQSETLQDRDANKNRGDSWPTT